MDWRANASSATIMFAWRARADRLKLGSYPGGNTEGSEALSPGQHLDCGKEDGPIDARGEPRGIPSQGHDTAEGLEKKTPRR